MSVLVATADRLVIPGLTADEQDELDFLLRQLHACRPRNLLRTGYYEFRHLHENVSPVVPPVYNKIAFTMGWTGKAVDALARRVTFEECVWPEGDLESLDYKTFHDQNHMRSTVKAATVGSLLHGVSFLVNTKGGDGEPSSLVHHKDALSATGRWNARRRALDSFVSVSKWGDEQKSRPLSLALYLPNLTITADYDKASRSWEVDKQGHPWGVPAEAVIYKPWSRTFGSSRITRPMMSLQDRAVAGLVRMEAHMDIYAIPDYWLLGGDQSILENEDGSLRDAWRVMMGRIKGLPDVEQTIEDYRGDNLDRATVQQFAAQSPAPHLAAINAFAKMFAREADLPDSALAITDVSNPTSADSYIESREALIGDAETTIDDSDLPVRRAVARGLAIQNGLDSIPAEWSAIESKWRKPVYLSRSAEADAGAKQLASGPEWLRDTEVGLELMGLDAQQIRRALAERRKAAGRGVLVALRDQVGGEPLPAPDDAAEAAGLKAKFDALGVAIRAGVDPAAAAQRLGLSGIRFTGATPTSLRLPEQQAEGLEER